jgi:hypothetical protein
MRSIASNWAKSYREHEALVLESQLRRTDEEGREFSPLDHFPDLRSNPEQRLRNRQTLDQIDALFKGDEKAQMVIAAWRDGYDPAGTRQLWGFSQNEYNTVVRRIRRTLDSAGITPDRERGATYVP